MQVVTYDKEFCYLWTIKVMADVNLRQDTDQTSAQISQSRKLSPVVLITSRPMHQNTKPKRTYR